MALGGLVLSHTPQRTCTGCRAVIAQADLVRVAFDGTRLVLDPTRRVPGRGAYVHARKGCVTAPGLAKSLRRSVTPGDIQQLVAEMSPTSDKYGRASSANSSRSSNDLPGDHLGKTAVASRTEKL